MAKPDHSMRNRILWIALLLVTWMIAIIWRLSWLQVVQHEHYLSRAVRNQQREVELTPLRGAILDRNGKELAYTVISDSVYVDLKLLKEEQDRMKAVRVLAPLLGAEEADLLKKMTGNASFVWLKRKLEPGTARAVMKAIEESRLNGLGVKKETQRFYPNDSIAAHLVGYVGAEDKGLAGLEQTHDSQLRGKPGEVDLRTDAAGRAFQRHEIPPTSGAQLYTTIDLALQHKVEVLLDEALKMTGARGASAIVIDPKNGEVLALANAPAFNPNDHPKNSDSTTRQNRAISFPFEPGSVFKLVTYSAAFEEGLAKPGDQIDCGNGQIKIGKRILHDTNAYGVLSVADAFAKSSNVGTYRLAQRVGKEKFLEYIKQFGFGRKTGIELPGESRGIVKKLDSWRADSIGSIAIGHEVSVTLMQTVSAMGAIANRGVWMQPHVVKQLQTEYGRILYEAKPVSRRVVSEMTAQSMTEILQRVVTSGTARHAVQLSGYTAAGKTGTPEKVDERTGTYSQMKYMPSFAGFVPASDPRFAIVVMIDEPRTSHYGGIVAAPVFNLIAEAALGDFAVPPDDRGFREALVQLSKKERESGRVGERDRERTEERESGDLRVSANISLFSLTSQNGQKGRKEVSQRRTSGREEASGIMPNFRGRGIRAVLEACAELDLKANFKGSGIAVRQEPAPGSRVKPGGQCRVVFQ
jgi:cell division protein FtsI (penicillin-binding protein 3)